MSKDTKGFVPKGEETIREEVIKDFGFNPDDQKDLIDKITSERMESQRTLTKAIEQKIHYRNRKNFYKAKANTTKEPVKKEDNHTQIDTSNFVTKDELEKRDLRHKHSYMSDDDFNFVDALAKGKGKKFEECLDDPIVKEHFEGIEARNRIAGATSAPSHRFKSSGETKEQKIANELNRDLPVGFAPKKK